MGLQPRHRYAFPHQFSGGQRQRIGTARALSTHPEVLILDEPVSALDVSVQAQVVNLFRDLQEQFDMGMIFISHDLSVVRHVSDDVVVMYLGQIVERGPAEAVLTTPHHPYTEALISAAPGYDDGGTRRERIVLTGEVPSPVEPAHRLPVPVTVLEGDSRVRAGAAARRPGGRHPRGGLLPPQGLTGPRGRAASRSGVRSGRGVVITTGWPLREPLRRLRTGCRGPLRPRWSVRSRRW